MSAPDDAVKHAERAERIAAFAVNVMRRRWQQAKSDLDEAEDRLKEAVKYTSIARAHVAKQVKS